MKTPHSLPKLPVANALWKAQPDLPTASEAWILAGGAHHTVFSHALNLNDMRQFAEMHDIEITVIDNDTRLPAFKDALRWERSVLRISSLNSRIRLSTPDARAGASYQAYAFTL